MLVVVGGSLDAAALHATSVAKPQTWMLLECPRFPTWPMLAQAGGDAD
jgi:hypothetical protein